MYNETGEGESKMNMLSDFASTAVQKRILITIYRHPGITRSELAAIAGISEKSAIRYVGDFLNRRVLVVSETRSSSIGRSSELLTLNPELFTVLALDIGGYSVKAGLVDLSGRVIEKKICLRNDMIGANIPITEQIGNMLAEVIKKGRRRPIGLGIGISGMVDRKNGKILYSPNFPGIRNVDVAESFGEKLGIPVCLDTSARCLALAETRYGGHENADNMIYISAGHSISAGIIADGSIFRGAGDAAGEIGHTKCTDSDERCTCGSTGCLELYASMPMIISAVREHLRGDYIYSPIIDLVGDLKELTVEKVRQAFDLHDRFVTEAMSEAGKKLGSAVAYYVGAFNPRLVVFGGSLTEFFPFVIEEAIREIKRTVLPAALIKTQLTYTKLDSNDAAIKGAALQVQNEYFAFS